jgi:hypothetical protein
MKSIIQIIKVNELRTGNKDGRTWEMQDAECILLNDDGDVESVGVLQLPKELRGNTKTGTYLGTFALRPNLSTRRIEAVLTGLQPYAVKAPRSSAATAWPCAFLPLSCWWSCSVVALLSGCTTLRVAGPGAPIVCMSMMAVVALIFRPALTRIVVMFTTEQALTLLAYGFVLLLLFLGYIAGRMRWFARPFLGGSVDSSVAVYIGWFFLAGFGAVLTHMVLRSSLSVFTTEQVVTLLAYGSVLLLLFLCYVAWGYLW